MDAVHLLKRSAVIFKCVQPYPALGHILKILEAFFVHPTPPICVDLIINRVSYELYRLHGLINHQINWVMEQFTQLTPITVG